MWTCFIVCIQFLLLNVLCESGALDSNIPILPTFPYHRRIILFHVTTSMSEQLYLAECKSVSSLWKIDHPPKVLDLPVTYRKLVGRSTIYYCRDTYREHLESGGAVRIWAQHVKTTRLETI